MAVDCLGKWAVLAGYDYLEDFVYSNIHNSILYFVITLTIPGRLRFMTFSAEKMSQWGESVTVDFGK